MANFGSPVYLVTGTDGDGVLFVANNFTTFIIRGQGEAISTGQVAPDAPFQLIAGNSIFINVDGNNDSVVYSTTGADWTLENNSNNSNAVQFGDVKNATLHGVSQEPKAWGSNIDSQSQNLGQSVLVNSTATLTGTNRVQLTLSQTFFGGPTTSPKPTLQYDFGDVHIAIAGVGFNVPLQGSINTGEDITFGFVLNTDSPPVVDITIPDQRYLFKLESTASATGDIQNGEPFKIKSMFDATTGGNANGAYVGTDVTGNVVWTNQAEGSVWTFGPFVV
jgi:hypothetical protein